MLPSAAKANWGVEGTAPMLQGRFSHLLQQNKQTKTDNHFAVFIEVDNLVISFVCYTKTLMQLDTIFTNMHQNVSDCCLDWSFISFSTSVLTDRTENHDGKDRFVPTTGHQLRALQLNLVFAWTSGRNLDSLISSQAQNYPHPWWTVMTHWVTPVVRVLKSPAELCQAGTSGKVPETKILWSWQKPIWNCLSWILCQFSRKPGNRTRPEEDF